MSYVKYKGYTIEIHLDTVPHDPREYDNLGKMVCFHGRHNLGDKHDLSIEDAKMIERSSKHIALPLYLYDHYGITMNTIGFSCPWDSGQVGVIYVDKAAVRKEWGWKRLTPQRIQKIEGILRSEVEVYDQYLRGDVYGYTVEDPDGSEKDSCCGFFGEDHKKSGLLDYARSSIDREVAEAEELKKIEEMSDEDLLFNINTKWYSSKVEETYKKKCRCIFSYVVN